MPRFRTLRDSGSYVLQADRGLSPHEQVRFHHRDPLPSESARLEDQAGHMTFGEVRVDESGERSALTVAQRWHGNGATVAIEACLLLLTDVTGPGPDGEPLRWPKGEVDGDDGKARKVTRKDRELFLGQFAQADLIEVGNHLLERRHLTEVAAGN